MRIKSAAENFLQGIVQLESEFEQYLATAKTTIEKKLASLDAPLQQINERMTNLENSQSAKLEEFRIQYLAALEKRVFDIERRAQVLEQKNQTLEQKNQTLEQRIQKMDARRQKLIEILKSE